MHAANAILTLLAAHLLGYGALFFVLASRMRRLPGLRAFALGNTLFGASYVLQLLHPTMGWHALNVVNHSCTVLALTLYVVGLKQFLGLPAAGARAMVALALGYTVAQAAVEVAFGPLGRYLLLPVYATSVLAWAGGLLAHGAFQRDAGSGALRVELLLVAVFAWGMSALNAAKLVVVARGGLAALTMSSTFQTVFYGAMSIAVVALGPTIIFTLFRRLAGELQAAASHDALTSTLNRRGMAERLQTQLEQPPAQQARLLMLDIDHFKRINDTHGHLVGDEMLRRVSATITAGVRKGDFVARTGGEEFVVGCFDTDPATAWALAERLRAAVEATVGPPGAAGTPVPATVSIGISAAFTTLDELDRALGEADRALYHAKQTGRNRVVAGPLPAVPAGDECTRVSLRPAPMPNACAAASQPH